MTSLLRLLPFLLLCLAPLAVQAQERVTERSTEPAARAPERPATSDVTRSAPREVPREMLPPSGKCRIWMAGVAPAQQPAPTDCQTALRQRPANGTVVFGPASKEAPAHGFARPRPARDTTAREASPSRSASPSRGARPADTSTRSDSASRRRPPEPQF